MQRPRYRTSKKELLLYAAVIIAVSYLVGGWRDGLWKTLLIGAIALLSLVGGAIREAGKLPVPLIWAVVGLIVILYLALFTGCPDFVPFCR